MTKTKISLANLQGKLSRAEMKEVLGGGEIFSTDDNYYIDNDGGNSSCVTTNDCPTYSKCSGSPGTCVNVPLGTACTSNYDCGKGSKCVSYSFPTSSKFCGIN